MPLQRFVRSFREFQGDHEGLGSLLTDLLSPSDSQNIYFEKKGAVARAPGYLKVNTAYTTDTGSSATFCVGLYPYFTGSAIEIIGVFDDTSDEYELAVSTNNAASFTFGKDLGTNLNDKIPDSGQIGSKMIMTFGKGLPQKYSGSSFADVGETRSPTPAAAAGGAGNLRGQYEVKLVSVETDGTRHAASVSSAVVELAGKELDLTWTQDSDTDVVGYEVYVKKKTEGLFRFTQYVNGRTTAAATVNKGDLARRRERALREHGDPPITDLHFCEPFQKSMFYSRTAAKPRSLYYSDPNKPEQVWAESELLLQDSDSMSDEIRGLHGGLDGILTVFQQESVWTVSGTGDISADGVDWRVRKSDAMVGAASHRAVIKVPPGAKFLDASGQLQTTEVATLLYLSSFLDLRLFNGRSDQLISHSKRDFFASVNYANRAKAHIQAIPDTDLIIIYVPHGSSQTTVNKGIVWNWRLGTMTEITNRPFACSLTTLSATGTLALTGQSLTAAGGLIYNPWTGNNYDGSGTIDAQYWSELIFAIKDDGSGPRLAMESDQRFRWCKPIFEVLASSRTVSVALFEGFAVDGATAFATKTIDITGSNVSHVSQRLRFVHSSTERYSADKIHRIKIFTNDANPAWVLAAFDIQTQTLLGIRG